MKPSIKKLMLAAAVALCLMVVPAFSAPDVIANGYGNMGRDGMGPGDMCRFAGPDDGASGCVGGAGGCLLDNASKNPGHNIVRSGKGFASSGDQYHVVNLNVKGIVDMDPETIEKIVSDNKTLGQIKNETRAAVEAATTYSGKLRLGNDMYVLKSVNMSHDDGDNATLSADVAGPISMPDRLNNTCLKPSRDNISDLNKTEMRARIDAEKEKIQAEIDSAPIAGKISLKIATIDDRFQIGQGQITIGNATYDAVVNMGRGLKGMGDCMTHCGMGHMGKGMQDRNRGMPLEGR